MDNQPAGRIHYGRQDTLSRNRADGEPRAADSYQEPARMPGWYDESSSADAGRERRKQRYNKNTSVWDESKSARSRAADRQGTARDARRIQQRHERQAHRTPNRNTVYNTGGTQNDVDMFQAVAAGDHMDHQPYMHNNGGLGGINSKGSWHSSSATRYPALREHHRNDFVKIALPVVIVILAIVAIALGVHSCVSA